MDILNLLVKLTVQDEATPEMESISAGIIAKGQLIADAIESAMKTAVGTIRDFIGQSLEAFGEYEQMADGMKTFFGDAADTVIENAKNAYETAGMSANAYMQNATVFATSLIQSVKKRRSEAIESSTEEMVSALDQQYEAAKSTYDNEYKAMQRSFNNQNRELQRYLSDQVDALREAHQESLEAAREANQERLDAARESFEQEKDALKEAQEEEVEEYKKATEERIKLIDDEYTERLKLIDEDEYNRVKAVKDQIASLENQTKTERDALKKRERARREAELRSAISTAKTAEQRQKAQQQLTSFLEKSAQEEREAARKSEIDNLKDKLTAIKDDAKQRRDELKKGYQEERKDYIESRKQGLADLRESQSEQMKALTDEQKKKLEAMKKAQADELKEMQKAQAAELKEMQRANQDQLQAVRDGQQEQLSELKSAQNKRLKQLKDTLKEEKKLLESGGGDDEMMETTVEDQQEAARLIELANRDIADNVAKTGVAQESIVRAYRGFSMGNFTMLDNLHIGYQGTRSEMERLLSDAEKLKAKNGEVVDYSIDNFADIIDAIHVIQENIGLTGTAANEGATTLQGATMRMQAAWQNWLISLADDEYDVGESTKALMDSVGTYAGLVIPRIAKIIKTVFDYIKEHGPEIWEQFKQAMMDALPDEWKEKLQGIMDKLSEFMTHLPETIELVKNLAIAFAGLQVVGTIAGAFSSLTSVVGMVTQGLGGLSGAAQAAAGGGGLAGVGSAAGSAAGEVGKLTGAAAEAAGAGGLGKLAGAASGAGGTLASALGPAAIAGGAMAGVGLLTNSVLESTGSIDRFRETVKNGTYDATAQFTHMSTSAVNNANTVNSSYGRMKQEIATATQKMASDTDNSFKGMAKSISTSGQNAASSIGNIKSQMKNAFSNAGDWLKPAGSNIITGLWNGLKQKFREVQNWFSGLGSWIQQHKGPKEYDLGLLVNNGRWIMQSLETGLRKGFPLIEGTIGELTDMIQNTDFDATASLSMDAKAVKAQPEDEGIRTFGQRKAKREQKETTVILMLDRTEFARAVYKANNDETQRVGLRLAGGYA